MRISRAHAALALTGPDSVMPEVPAIVHSYSRQDFDTLMHTGMAIGGRELGLMTDAAKQRFINFDDSDLTSLYSYLSR